MSASASNRPVSTAYHSRHHQQHLHDIQRDRSGSGSSNMPPLPPQAMAAAGTSSPAGNSRERPDRSNSAPLREAHYQHSKGQNGHIAQYSGGSSVPSTQSYASQGPSASASSTPASTSLGSSLFQPLSLEQLLPHRSADPHHALQSLLAMYNQLGASSDAEKSRLAGENKQLWSWCSGLKKERDNLQRELAVLQSSSLETRNLSTRVQELEAMLQTAGLPVPPRNEGRLSPAPSSGTTDSQMNAGEDLDRQRRPSPGTRSISDSGPFVRERQRSNQSQMSDREKERYRAGHSLASSSSSASLATTAGEGREVRPRRAQTQSQFSDGAARSGKSSPVPRGMAASMPPLSASASMSSNLSSYQSPPQQAFNGSTSLASEAVGQPTSYSQRDREGLAAIPSTPVITDGTDLEGNGQMPVFISSPTSAKFERDGSVHSNGSGPTSASRFVQDVASPRHHHQDSNSSEYLTVERNNAIPVSPALSSASSFSQAQSTGSRDGPRSPLHQQQSRMQDSSPDLQSGFRGSPRHPALAQYASQSRQYHAQQAHAVENPVPSGHTLGRKASSLDLSRPQDKISPVIGSRSATPPADLSTTSAPSARSRVPDASNRYASTAVHEDDEVEGLATAKPNPAYKTPPSQSLGQFADASTPLREASAVEPDTSAVARDQFGTPMVDIPDGTRQAILAVQSGGHWSSPVSPNFPKKQEDRSSSGPRVGGLGISHSHGTAGDSSLMSVPQDTRPRRASSALQAIAAQQIVGSRQSPTESSTAAFKQHSAHANSFGHQPTQQLQEAHWVDNATGRMHDGDQGDTQQHSSSPVKSLRPSVQERVSSDRSADSGRTQEAYIPQKPQRYPLAQQIQQPPPPRTQRSRDDYMAGESQNQRAVPALSSSVSGGSNSLVNYGGPPVVAPKCLVLIPDLLSLTTLTVINSSIKMATADGRNNKEAISFLIKVDVAVPQEGDARRSMVTSGNMPRRWLIEKSWNDLVAVDTALKAKNTKSSLRKLPPFPDRSLFKDNAPLKVDQRKSDLAKYLSGVCSSTLHERVDFCNFLTSNIVSDHAAPVTKPGYKAGYLTKKGKTFGGWQTRYYVLQGRHLEYYDSEGGEHLGSIDIKGASIGRQNAKANDGGDAVRHAFLVRARHGVKSGEDVDHVLCAESDEERDAWVEMLVCCLTGEYVPSEAMAMSLSRELSQSAQPQAQANAEAEAQARAQAHAYAQVQAQIQAKAQAQPQPRGAARQSSRDIEIRRTDAQPISNLTQQASNAKLFGGPSYKEPLMQEQPTVTVSQHRREQSAGQSSTASGPDDFPHRTDRGLAFGRRGYYGSDLAPSSSLPSNLDQLAHSESSHSLPSSQTVYRSTTTIPASTGSGADSTYENQAAVSSSAQGNSNRPRSPEKRSVKISGPSNGAPIGADFKKPVPSDRKAKVKSSFWDFAHRRGTPEQRRDPNAPPPRPVFGVPLQEAVEVARVREDSELPAVLFRCVQYLTAVGGEKEEGIYRLSGSSAVIKGLKERFNLEGDVDLTSEYFDPHAVAGLLKQFFRDLPVHIFTNELNSEFIGISDIEDHNTRVHELTRLVQLLPVVNYTALRFLSAHLVNIVKHESVNKMSVRNMGIVFSPTLGISATLFGLFINEFDRIFREIEPEAPAQADQAGDATLRERQRTDSSNGTARRRSRNSTLFTQSGADRLLEMVHDLENPQEEEEPPETSSESEQSRASDRRHNVHRAQGRSAEDAIKAQHRGKLTIDVANRGDPHDQSSASIHSASSPRHLTTPKSPLYAAAGGLPASPRPRDNHAIRRD